MPKRKFESQADEWRAKKLAVEAEAKRRGLDLHLLEKNGRSEKSGLKACKKILDEQFNNPDSKPYIHIDRNASWYSAYRQAIKNVIDYRTICKKYANDEYRTVHELAKDVRLMWDNAMVFNRPSEIIWKNAWKFLKEFERRFSKEVLTKTKKSVHGEIYYRVIHTLWSDHNAHYFHAPVDWVKLGLTNYQIMVKRPMCFTKVRDRCHSYQNQNEFLADLNQVFDNATTYNPASTEVHQTAVILKRKAHEVLVSLLPETDTAIEDVDDGPVAGLDEEVLSEEDDYSLSQQQMEWLSEHFYELDEDRIQPIVDKLSEYSKQEGEDEEPTIDLQELPPKLLYEAYKYVKDSLRVQKQMNEGAGISTGY